MEKQYEALLNHLFKAEGGKLHKNSKELDITNAYGIYRYANPKAEIWNYIDGLAMTVTRAPSKAWDAVQIAKVNNLIDKKIERELSYNFYKKYLAPLKLELYPDDLTVTLVDCFANTQTGTYKAIQEGLNDCYKYGLFKFTPKKPQPNGNILLVDGDIGSGTIMAINAFFNNPEVKDPEIRRLQNIIFKNCMLLYMKSYYAEITVGKPDKFLGVLKGLCNRMENAQHLGD